jgi:hypothetical protein
MRFRGGRIGRARGINNTPVAKKRGVRLAGRIGDDVKEEISDGRGLVKNEW